MALIQCPDCRNEVSDKAPNCPKCGRQIAAITIEKTGKGIKSAKAASVVLLLIAVPMLCGGAFSRSFGAFAFGAMLFLVGGPLFIGSTVLRWWRHD